MNDEVKKTFASTLITRNTLQKQIWAAMLRMMSKLS